MEGENHLPNLHGQTPDRPSLSLSLQDTKSGTGDMGLLGRLSLKWLVVLVSVTTIGAASAVSLLVTHTIPSIPVFNPAAPVVSSTCTTLTGAPGNIAQGTSGIAVFDCNNQPALTIRAPGSATPSFTLPSGYSSLSIAQFPGATYCFGAGAITLTSGQPVSFATVNNAYDYCASYTSAQTPSLPTFQVSWSSS